MLIQREEGEKGVRAAKADLGSGSQHVPPATQQRQEKSVCAQIQIMRWSIHGLISCSHQLTAVVSEIIKISETM